MFLRVGVGFATAPLTLGVTTKLSQQYVGPFRVIERVGRLAYRLDIPEHWKVYHRSVGACSAPIC
jgi:hypothetical protein